MKKSVGFDYNLEMHQLDYIAKQLKRTPSKKELYEIVDRFLMADIAGNEARKKARTILFKIWVLVPPENKSLRDRALELLDDATLGERLMLHWGLILMAYPFFREMAGQAGRLLQIQGEFSTIQIRRKMSALYGEREKVNVATKKILKTWKDLNVIVPKEKGFIGQVIPITNTIVKQWVCEAYLRATEKVAVEVNHLHEEPSLFPFQFTLVEQELKGNNHLQLIYGQEAIRVGIR